MKVDGQHYRTIWLEGPDPGIVRIINQQLLPHHFEIIDIPDLEAMCTAIQEMTLRGAGLIGAAAGYGMYLAAREAAGTDDPRAFLQEAAARLIATRPTAANLANAVHRQERALAAAGEDGEALIRCARATAHEIADEDAEYCRRIGMHGLALLEEIHARKGGGTVNILTHCNAGWLAFVDHGSATAPVYAAHDAGIPVHVWVDETRPRNQGAALTAWELGQHGVPHHLVPDNAGGHLMQHGMVDLVITGADRVTACGDAANKIGTYLKALAAYDNGIPFYVALPGSTFDWSLGDGVSGIPIETRNPDEVRHARGALGDRVVDVLVCPASTPAVNYGFDVTPARLISALITERGIVRPDRDALAKLYPECVHG